MHPVSAILPETAILQEVADGTMKAINILDEGFFRPTGILTRKNKLFGPAGRYLIDLLRTRGQAEKLPR